MSQARLSKSNKFRRDAWLEINLAHLESNIKQIHGWLNKPLIPVIKADAYGHGASMIAPILEAYDFVESFAVASLDEALTLREAKVKKPIMVLGISPVWAFDAALENDIELTLVDLDSAYKLNELNKAAKVHIKIDTGMNRIGFKADKLSIQKQINEISELPNIEIRSIFSHFSTPNNAETTMQQLNLFNELTQGFSFPRHIASSGAGKIYPESCLDKVRVGIELYGLDNNDLKPLMSLYSRITFIKEIKAGEAVSYHGTWLAKKDTRIATLPLGYADGVRRPLSNKMKGFINGKEFSQVGNITMDQLMFDIGFDENIKVGDIVELIGPNIHVDAWAKNLDTISYEIVTGLNLRLPKVYTRPNAIK